MKAQKWIAPLLQEIWDEGTYRSPKTYPRGGARFELKGESYLNFSSNDYLGLSESGKLTAAAKHSIERTGLGTMSSRVLTGTLEEHLALEQDLAEFLSYHSALTFGAGYLANIGVIPVLVGRNDLVCADKLVHASLIDGINLSRATLHRFRHNDLGDLERRLSTISSSRSSGSRLLIVTESVFSMDGDLAVIPALVELAKRFEAMLYVDEAHALGVFWSSWPRACC